MKKLIAIALIAAFTSAAGLALADGKDGAACKGKCAGKHWKKDAKHHKKIIRNEELGVRN